MFSRCASNTVSGRGLPEGVGLPLQLTGYRVFNGSPQQALIYGFMQEIDKVEQSQAGCVKLCGWDQAAIVS